MGSAAQLQIPVKLTLAQSDNVSSAPLKPVYLLAPRQSYLPALAEQALRSFEHVLLKPPGQGAAFTPWFEFGGVPLSWTLPCGTLFDIIAPPPSPPAGAPAGAGGAAGSTAGVGTAAAPLPWVLTVHYRDVPPALAPAWANAGAARDQYFTSLKEAIFICRGPEGANAVMRMSSAAQDELWRCVAAGRGPEAAPGWAALRPAPAVVKGGGPSIPVRVFIVSAEDAAQGGAFWERAYSSSRPVEALQPDGLPTTVAHAIYKVVPHLFSEPPPAPAAELAAAPAAGGAEAAAAAAPEEPAAAAGPGLAAAQGGEPGAAAEGEGDAGAGASAAAAAARAGPHPRRAAARAWAAAAGARMAAAAGGAALPLDAPLAYDDDKPWMTPRIAFKLYSTAVFLSDVAQHSDPDALDLPPAAAPFAARRAWRAARAGAGVPADRGAAGQRPGAGPNCTGEEMALHLAVDWAREYDRGGNDEESAQLDWLPQAEMDDDWELVQDAAVQDEDVQMLFDDKVAPQLLAGGTLAAVMGVTHLHPSEWFVAFKPHKMTNHLPDSLTFEQRRAAVAAADAVADAEDSRRFDQMRRAAEAELGGVEGPRAVAAGLVPPRPPATPAAATKQAAAAALPAADTSGIPAPIVAVAPELAAVVSATESRTTQPPAMARRTPPPAAAALALLLALLATAAGPRRAAAAGSACVVPCPACPAPPGGVAGATYSIFTTVASSAMAIGDDPDAAAAGANHQALMQSDDGALAAALLAAWKDNPGCAITYPNTDNATGLAASAIMPVGSGSTGYLMGSKMLSSGVVVKQDEPLEPGFPVSWALVSVVSENTGDPHLQAFSGQKYGFCEANGNECQGHAFNLITEARHQLNTEVNRMAGPDAWPAAGTWMTGFGMRVGGFSFEARLRTDVEHEIVADPKRGEGLTRALPPAGGKGRFRALLSKVAVGGADAMARVESGDTLEADGGVTVHFPDTRHRADPTDGPLAVITTPDMMIMFYIESEDTWHLDFSITLRPGHKIKRMHGLLGQTLHWDADQAADIEGGEMAYALSDGLLGTAFKYNLFGTTPRWTAPRHQLASAAAGGVAAGSARLLEALAAEEGAAGDAF
ncbi:MAG: hypothetical protein J3K34DRAFT_524984 [Monoraphidium minutum]|nr:MAG: hypothetical protein J3K34DRAFT_524984 [Monoraphidium minutum]